LISRVRSLIIITIFFGYLFVMFSLVAIWTKGGFDFDEFTTTVAIVAPLLASHIAAIVAFAQTGATDSFQQREDRRIPRLNAIIAVTPPIALLALIVFSIYGKGFNLISITFEQFKVLIAVINSMFGVYVSSLVTFYIKRQQSQITTAQPGAT
jgi:hypothetical protein